MNAEIAMDWDVLAAEIAALEEAAESLDLAPGWLAADGVEIDAALTDGEADADVVAHASPDDDEELATGGLLKVPALDPVDSAQAFGGLDGDFATVAARGDLSLDASGYGAVAGQYQANAAALKSVVYIETFAADGKTSMGTGSGVMVGANDVLTAAHVIHDPKLGYASYIKVTPAYDPSTGKGPLGSFWAKTWHADTGYTVTIPNQWGDGTKEGFARAVSGLTESLVIPAAAGI